MQLLFPGLERRLSNSFLPVVLERYPLQLSLPTPRGWGGSHCPVAGIELASRYPKATDLQPESLPSEGTSGYRNATGSGPGEIGTVISIGK